MDETLSSQLASAGGYVSEEDQVFSICNVLDGDYEFVVVIIQESGASVQELTHKLLVQEDWLKRRNSIMLVIPSTNVHNNVLSANNVQSLCINDQVHPRSTLVGITRHISHI